MGKKEKKINRECSNGIQPSDAAPAALLSLPLGSPWYTQTAHHEDSPAEMPVAGDFVCQIRYEMEIYGKDWENDDQLLEFG